MTKACPFCAEQIQEDAIKCKFCGEFFEVLKDVEYGSYRHQLKVLLISKYFWISALTFFISFFFIARSLYRCGESTVLLRKLNIIMGCGVETTIFPAMISIAYTLTFFVLILLIVALINKIRKRPHNFKTLIDPNQNKNKGSFIKSISYIILAILLAFGVFRLGVIQEMSSTNKSNNNTYSSSSYENEMLKIEREKLEVEKKKLQQEIKKVQTQAGRLFLQDQLLGIEKSRDFQSGLDRINKTAKCWRMNGDFSPKC